MKNLSTISPDRFKNVRAVAFDIDDTITTDGRVTADAYQALWHIHQAGLILLAVTGRPAGWCDLIARAWPVDGVIGENGAFAYLRKDRAIERIDVAPAPTERQLNEMKKHLLQRFPNLGLSSDQFCRRFDLAIDFAEEVGPFPVSTAEKVAQAFEASGWTAKVSSIHVNGWKGHWDKASTLSHCLSEHYQLTPDQVAYVGDSPNDAPMFALAGLSVGVANICDFPMLKTPPEFITTKPQGAGFSEFTELLLRTQGFTFHQASD